MKDYYKILELPFGTASTELKAAYRRLAFKFHPDKNLNNKLAEEKFKEITEAYSILSDDNKRMLYHEAYNDFLNSRYLNRIPEPTYRRPPYYNPTDIPKQPRGPATTATISVDGIKIAVLLILIIVLINFIFFNRLKKIENESKYRDVNISTPYAAPVENNTDIMSKDDFYKVIYQEFVLTGDSTLLNANIDSLKHVFDSLQQAVKH